MLGWRVFLAAIVTTVLGCHGEAVDAVIADAGHDAPAGVELLNNPGFELGCAAWETGEATAEESTIARSGSRSCRVCAMPGVGAYFFSQAVEGVAVGTKYLGEAWLRADDGAAGVAPDPTGRLELLDKNMDQIDIAEVGTLALDKTWKRTSALITVKPGTDKLRLEFWSHGPGTCFLIDDASLRVVP